MSPEPAAARSNTTALRLWAWPLALGLLTCTGLVSALLSDGGWGDVWAWLALGVPVAVIAWRVFVPDTRER